MPEILKRHSPIRPSVTITDWNWIFGNGNTSILKDPPAQGYAALIASDYNAMPELIVKNDFGCYDYN